ncbi:unnamed protein product [Nippostrongylus brasiliensis]|uniref:PKD_channel domain-containing protein n=1 Tax=Nippostrongylus brasiliensis TaxID=27835 RepID=A0A0N4YAI4_NIPBR|nr:unnamed protein product [Nippostrongylus brasiliensis]
MGLLLLKAILDKDVIEATIQKRFEEVAALILLTVCIVHGEEPVEEEYNADWFTSTADPYTGPPTVEPDYPFTQMFDDLEPLDNASYVEIEYEDSARNTFSIALVVLNVHHLI